MQMKQLTAVLTAAVLLLANMSAAAIQIDVDPSSQNVTLGDPVSVDVNISGLGLGSAPSVGVFDIDVSFDTTLLDATSVVFGTGLDVLGFGSIQDVFGSGPVNVFELSLDPVSDLNALQPDAFKLFTMTFDTLASGTSAITLTLGLSGLGDADGSPLEASLVDGEISIESDGKIPLPATLLLLSAGLVGLGLGLGLQRR